MGNAGIFRQEQNSIRAIERPEFDYAAADQFQAFLLLAFVTEDG